MALHLSPEAKKRLREMAAALIHHLGGLYALQSRGQQRWRILMYHRTINPEESLYPLQPGMYVTPRTLDLHMSYLREKANVISLDDLALKLAAGEEIQPRTVAVTFDDGWHDSYTNAFPVLKRHRIPATIFLATSFIGTNKTLWGDEVALAVTALRKEKQYLAAACSRIKERSDIGADISSSVAAILCSDDERQVIEQLDALVERLKGVSLKHRKIIVSSLMNLAKEFTGLKAPRSFMNWDEVHEMAAGGIFFGSHTHKHYPLDQLSEAQIKDELDNSYQIMREKNIAPSAVFCYPNGNYNELSQQVLAAHDIKFAITVDKAPNLDARPMLLGRTGIHEDISRTLPLFTSRVWADKVF